MQILSNLSLYGTLGLNSVADANTDTDKFLVMDSNGIVKYRTGQELYNDIGAGGAAAYTSVLQHEVKASVALNKGQAVYVTTADGTNMIVGKASNASEPTSSKTLGLVAQNLAINDIGFVVTEGLLAGIDTSTALAGDPVWLGTDGNLLFGLSNKPHAPAHMVFIGIVTRVQQNNGEIFVKVQNGFELDELHNVQITSTPSDNAVLAYELSTGLYKMKSIPTLLGYTPVTDARTLTINGTSYNLSSDRAWSIDTGVMTASAGLGISLSIVNQNLNIVNTGILTASAGSGISLSVVNQNLNVVNTGILTASAGLGISLDVVNQNLNVINTGILTASAGSGISLSVVGQNLNVINTGVITASAGAGISLSIVGGNLNVVNTITNNNQLTNGAGYITSSSLSGYVQGSGSSGQVTYWNGSSSQTGSNNLFWDTTNNRLGIGLTNPQRRVEIYSATADSHLRLSGSAPSVSLGEAITGSIYQAKFGLATASGHYSSSAAAGDFVIISQTGATIWVTGTTDRLKLNYSGNFSIGNNNDTYKLDVSGTARFTSSVIAATYLTLSEDATYTGTYYTLGFSGNSNGANRIFGARDGSDGIYIASATSTPIHFRAGGGTTNHLIIASTGAATFSSSVTATSFIKSGGTSVQILAADGSVITAGSGITISGGTISSSASSGVSSFNTRTGAITLTSGDVTGALGYTPYNSSNPNGYISSYTETDTLASVVARGASTTSAITINKTGTLISHAGMTDAIGYNSSYGTYIGSSVGGTYYIYANGQMNNNGSIVTLLHSSNYNSYSPTLTGGGASGTWGISITGNAATLGGYSASTSVGANTVVVRDANNYIYAYYINSSVSESENPTINSFFTSNGDGWLRKSSVAHVKSQLGLGSMAYASYATYLYSPNGASVVSADSAMPSSGNAFQHSLALGPGGNDGHILGMTWANTTSVYGAQIWLDTDPTNRMAIRSRNSSGTWNGWWEVLTEGNYSSYAYPKTGGIVNGYIQNGSVWINNGSDNNSYNENIRLFNAPNGVSVIAFSASGTSGMPTTSILGYSDRLEFRYNNGAQYRIYNGYTWTSGDIYTDNKVYTQYNMRMGEIWGYGGLYRSSGDMMFGTDGGGWRFHYGNSQKVYIGTDGNIWMSWLGDYISNRIGQDVRSSASPTFQEVYANGWFRTTGYQGLYNPTNNAHFYPNNNSYGPWRIDGSRNGWNGIYFDTGVTLMMNGNESGHHREGYGWQYRWYNGSMYISTNSYGGGSEYTVIHSGNISNQSVSSAGYASSANYASSASYASSAGSTSSVSIPDWRYTSYGPNSYAGNNVNWHFNTNSYNANPPGDYWGAMMTVSPWSSYDSSHRQSQIWWGGSAGLSYRYAVSGSDWAGWERILTSTRAYVDGSYYGNTYRSFIGQFTFGPYSNYGVGLKMTNESYSDTYSVAMNEKFGVYNPYGNVAQMDVYSVYFSSGSSGCGGGYASYGGQGLGGYDSSYYGGGTISLQMASFKSYSNYYGEGIECNAWDYGNLYIGGSLYQNYWSDEKYKDNVSDIEDALDKVKAIRGVEYDWNELALEETGRNGHDVGVIAQEVQIVYPFAVREIDKEKGDHVQTALVVDYEKLIPLLVQSVKELSTRLDMAKTEIQTLKDRIDGSSI